MKKERKKRDEGEEVIENLQIRNFPKKLWIEFKKDVLERTGQTHGVLGEELAEIIRQHLYGEEREHPGGIPIKKSAHTHTLEDEIKEVEINNVAYAKEYESHEKGYALTSREKRLTEIGKMLYSTQMASQERNEKDFKVSLKGLKRLVTMQKISDKRVVQGYIETMELRGWILKTSTSKYSILPFVISDELHLHYDSSHAKKIIGEKLKEVNNNIAHTSW